MIKFSILGIPVAKGRPKFFRRGNFMGTYTPAKTRHYEDSVISQALKYKPEKPLICPLAVRLRFYLPIPLSFSKKRQKQAQEGILRPAKRPDLDNLIKMLDSFNTIFWQDDRQIVSIQAEKIYGEQPRTEIEIEEI